jgi:hypothetical protein
LESTWDLFKSHDRSHDRQVLRLALENRELLVGVGSTAQPDQLQTRDDRCERIAQLVAEHREELVLRAARGLGLRACGIGRAIQPRVLDRHGRATRERLEEWKILEGISTLADVPEADRTERAIAASRRRPSPSNASYSPSVDSRKPGMSAQMLGAMTFVNGWSGGSSRPTCQNSLRSWYWAPLAVSTPKGGVPRAPKPPGGQSDARTGP